MTDESDDRTGGGLRTVGRAILLRCPRCGGGALFRGWFRMHDACAACGVSFAREPGFYLGSIYLNYGITVIVTGALYAALVGACDIAPETALAACLVVAVVLPAVLFRHARSLLLAIDGTVNRRQSPGGAGEGDGARSREHLAGLAADDGRAGCAMGVALALVLLFGIGMAVATVIWSMRVMDPRTAADAVDLR